jgi:NAD(P)-dependent dehydrogenase (short-subunit alcohol dehydrogenase family)
MRAAVEWVQDHIPYQHGRLVLITSADGGVGFQAARLLVRRGAHVVLACRDLDGGREALRRMTAHGRDGGAELLRLDVGDLRAVRRAADELRERHDHLDVLINNAGVGGSHLGHFALTGLLLDVLLAGERPRVVTVTSNVYRSAAIRFDEPSAVRGQTALAQMLFTFELQRRCARAHLPLSALAAHPGGRAPRRAARPFAQGGIPASLPVVAAAALPEARGADAWGPTGRWQRRGLPAPVLPASNTTDIAAARRLWTLSEELTGVTFDIPERAAGHSA